MNMISEKENLQREIGIVSLTLAMVNSTVGMGIFVLPAIVAENLGAAAIVAYLVCGTLMFLIALCFAEVGSKVTSSGGIYAYIETAFGKYPGFIANNLSFFGSLLTVAAIANGLSDTLKYFFPLLGNEIFRVLFCIFIFGILALLNIRSVQNGIMFIEFATFAKLIPLILLVIVGIGFISIENLRWTSSPTIGNIAKASYLLIFAFAGLHMPLCNSGEIKNAKQTVPLAIFSGISIVLILYIAIQLVSQGILGNTMSAHKDSPLASVSGIIFGKTGAILIVLATAFSMLGALGGRILSIPRVLFAGARDGVMPKILAKVHPRYFTPHVAIIFYSSLGFLFSVLGEFKQLVILSIGATLLLYLGVVLATIILRKKNSETSEKTFRTPGVMVPMLAFCVIVWLLSSLSKQQIGSIVIFIFVFSLIYIATKLLKRKS